MINKKTCHVNPVHSFRGDLQKYPTSALLLILRASMNENELPPPSPDLSLSHLPVDYTLTPADPYARNVWHSSIEAIHENVYTQQSTFPINPSLVCGAYSVFTAQVSSYPLRDQLWPEQEAQPETNALSKVSVHVCVCLRAHDGLLCIEKVEMGKRGGATEKAESCIFWAYWISRWLWLEPVAWESVCFLPVVVNVIECSCRAFLHRALCLGTVQHYNMFSQDMLT